MPTLFEDDIETTEEEHSQNEGSGSDGSEGSGDGSEGSGDGSEGSGDGSEGSGDGSGSGSKKSSTDDDDKDDKEGSGTSGSKEEPDKGSSKEESDEPKDTKKDNKQEKTEKPKDEPKKKPEDDKKPDTGKKAETGGAAINLSGQLFKKGSGGLKKTEKRDMKIDGTVLKYYKKKDDEKTAKKIELKAAEISDGGEKKGQYWMKIKIQEGKDKGKIREIAAMSKDDSKKWMDALKAVATGAGTPTPEKKNSGRKKTRY